MGSETTLVFLKLEISMVCTFLFLKLFAAHNLPDTAVPVLVQVLGTSTVECFIVTLE